MPDRMFANQAIQLGVESTPGTGVAANKKLLQTSISPAVKSSVKTYRPMGQKYAGAAALSKEWTESKLEGPLNYGELTYLLASLLSYSAPAQQGGTAAYKWTFASSASSADTVKTYTIEQGDSVRALLHRGSGAVTGGTVVECTEESAVRYTEISDGVTYRHIGLQFRIRSQ